ncbi:transglycosylase family protein [Streptomyces sp. NPDC006334]|uniref:transglycosylase family protein n=1 Tax=Streptomyces sp. NPDC006334 TaxID=3156754 RepID=UPI0033B63B49
MLTGNGRHRRPRQAPALIVAAGVTGSAIAIPLLGASAASAADGTVWDRVAECESGGSWSANQGGGEYGGLSLSQEDWDKYGGSDYASRPDLASRNQQIAVAQKVLAGEGVGAWGTCGLTSGLTADAATGDVDTGLADDSSDSSITSGLADLSRGSGSSGSSGSSQESGNGSAGSEKDAGDSQSSPSASPSSPSSPSSGSSGSSESSSPAGDGSAKSDGASGSGGAQAGDSSPTESPKLDESDKSGRDAGSWSLVDTGSLTAGPAEAETSGADALGSGRHRGSTADESAGGTAPSSGRHAANPLGAAGTYTVRDGDSLDSIADSLGIDGGWLALYDANRDAIGADPADIAPGQTLVTVVG